MADKTIIMLEAAGPDRAALDNATLTVLVNGVPKHVRRSWFIDGGRAAESALARQILGTAEGLGGSNVLHIEEEAFDRVCDWLERGDIQMLEELTQDNAGELLEAADYFCLDRLQGAIHAELRRRLQVMEETLHTLERDVKMWRELHARIQSARPGRERGSNELASYTYKHRDKFLMVQAGPAVRALVEPAFSSYVTQLGEEIAQWQRHFNSFAALLKSTGHVVYQHRHVRSPGHGVPSLLPNVAGQLPTGLVAGAIGDRVRENGIRVQACYGRRHAQMAYPAGDGTQTVRHLDSSSSDDEEYIARTNRQPLRYGRITSITDDNDSEISVKWDDGSCSRKLHCGKKGGFALVYA